MTFKRRSCSTLLLCIGLCLATTSVVGADEPKTENGLPQLATKYALKIVSAQEAFSDTRRHGIISGDPASQLELDFYSPLLFFEFDLYPVDVVQKSGLQGIVLCKHLAFAGQKRTAIPDFDHNVLYLDVARGRHSEPYMRKVIHHEFFHIIDWADDEKLYQDDQWTTLNPRGFTYGKGGINSQDDPTVSVVNNNQAGFLNKYSTTGVEEDKAELFANMMVDWDAVMLRAESDKVVAMKTKRMQKLMLEFSSAADNDFWNRIKNAERPEVK